MSNKQTSGLGRKIQAYFAGLRGFEVGQTVQVVNPAGWNGHAQGETGVLVKLEVKRVFDRPVHTIVVGVRWPNGSINWGMHMSEKLQVVS